MVAREGSQWKPRERPGLFELVSGAFRVFARQQRSSEVRTPYANAASINTEFEVAVEPNQTIVTVFDGLMALVNPDNTNHFIELEGGQTAIATRGPGGEISFRTNAAPPLFGIMATNRVQWWVFYPAILDTDELEFPEQERAALTESLMAWRSGNLRQAWITFPQQAEFQSDASLIYYAALRIAAGETHDALHLLAKIREPNPAARGLRELISATLGQIGTDQAPGSSATAWLARSYWFQAQTNLANALDQARVAATKAVGLSPKNGLALARLAELEFSFGETPAAEATLRRTLTNSPEHAAAYAMRGFVSAAHNRNSNAAELFERALALDRLLPEAWLGRGLLAFRNGRKNEGMDDIQLAALLGGNRALLRSYLGKAFAEMGDSIHADAQFELALKMDPNDPTPLLYSALERYANNDANSAVEYLQNSIQLNENRAVFRSQLLLYEDRAVRAASLARIYQRVGLLEHALREAAVAVTMDYANPSAHLFQADSLNALRDPTRFNLKYETAWFNEWLLANALAPVDAGVLSPNLTHQEYTRLFSPSGLFLSSFGEARSDSQFRQLATHSGIFGRSAYAIDLDFQHNNGVRPNNDLDRTEVYVQFKQQLTDRDTALLIAKFQDYSSGDNFQYLDASDATDGFHANYRFDEQQDPIVVSIWRHDWSPGINTMVLVGRLENHQIFTDLTPLEIHSTPLLFRPPFNIFYESEFESFFGELNQIIRAPLHTFIGGIRIQSGSLNTSDRIIGNRFLAESFGDTSGQGIFHNLMIEEPFSRSAGYAYHTWEPFNQFFITGGIAVDNLQSPRNFRHVPIGPGHVSKTQVLPKGALVWEATDALTLRSMYAQSLGGVTFDEGFRLEPAQLAGFSQAYRTVIPESAGAVGSVSGHELELFSGAIDLKWPSRTYLGAQTALIRSEIDRTIGYFFLGPPGSQPQGRALQTDEKLEYQEVTVQASADQLVGRYWSIGARYQYSVSELEQTRSAIASPPFERANTHMARVQALFNGSKGFFGRAASTFWWQSGTQLPGGSEHHQIDGEIGWRFPRQRGEVSLGFMNALDENYQLVPLAGLPEFPHERVFFVRMRLNL